MPVSAAMNPGPVVVVTVLLAEICALLRLPASPASIFQQACALAPPPEPPGPNMEIESTPRHAPQ